MQLIATILFWWVLVALFLVLNIYLGSLAYGAYQRWKQKKKQEAEESKPPETKT